ncbi:MAG: bifunctional serine/threonine-protein kinase/formylglycine-generating enzyme family protein [Candidatus Eutrophobiaceae bacterium]
MNDYQAIVEALHTGKLAMRKLSRRLRKLAGKSPELIPELFAKLEEAHDAGRIGDADYFELREQLSDLIAKAAQDGGGNDASKEEVGLADFMPRGISANPDASLDSSNTGDDATVMAGSEDADDATVMAGSEDADDATVMAGSEDADDATVMAGSEDADDATVMAGSEDADDATVMAGSEDADDATVMAGSEDADDATVALGASDSEDATVMAGGSADEEDATVALGASSSEDATVALGASGAEDATVISELGASGNSALDPSSCIDLSSNTVDGSDVFSVDPSAPDSTFGSQDSTQAIEEVTGDLSGGYGEGSVIKQRFRLEKVLGIGGMGKVYRAMDLLKEEAKDKNPQVAVKLLNDDFKNHPEAFISLQRESSRQQKLAHPNIATIYDFDRVGGRGTPVFITMELMEGMELKDYIRKNVRSVRGLPFQKAYEIIKQLGAGLSYAHERNLVHSDFKPGNAFMCNNGIVKTLDFGIARAVKNPMTGEAEKTLFDPGKLGALTPAYASAEMLEGKDPDTRDDTYALGCTAYELLVGQHPFNKKPANKAEAQGLRPPHIKALNRKQNRALQRAVAFRREDRWAHVHDFVEELEGKATFHKNPFFIAAVLLVFVGIAMIGPATDYLQQQKLEKFIAQINQGNKPVASGLQEMRQMEPATLAAVADKVKSIVQADFARRIASIIDISKDDYDFKVAEDILEEVAEFYPETIFYNEQKSLIDENRTQFVAKQNNNFIEVLSDPTKIDTVAGILADLAKVVPNHPLLSDPRPAVAYREFARSAFKEGQFQQALAYVTSGLENASADQRLIDMRSNIERGIKVAELEENLDWVEQDMDSLPDYLAQESVIKELAGIDPGNEKLVTIGLRMKGVVEGELSKLEQQGDRVQADTFVENYNQLFTAIGYGGELVRAMISHRDAEDRMRVIEEMSERNSAVIEQALRSPNIEDSAWLASVLSSMETLRGLASYASPETQRVVLDFQPRIAELYADEAKQLMVEERYDVANDLLDRGALMAPNSQVIADTRAEVERGKQEEEKIIRVETNQQDLVNLTRADDIDSALAKYEALEADLGENDVYFVSDAGPMLGDSYERVAKRRAEANDFLSAMALAKKGFEVNPVDIELKNLADQYEAEVNIANLLGSLAQSDAPLPADAAGKIRQISAGAAPGRSAEFTTQAAELAIQKIKHLREINEFLAPALAKEAARMFPSSTILAELADQLKLKPWEGYAQANGLLKEYKLTEAQNFVKEAEKFVGHQQYDAVTNKLKFSVDTAKSFFQSYIDAKQKAEEDHIQLQVSKSYLKSAMTYWVDNKDYASELEVIDDLIEKFKPKRVQLITREDKIDQIGLLSEEWEPISSSSECTARLAGYGRRAKAVCFDMIHQKFRGPLMVVVPKSEEMETSFAIGKYEISIGDWSKYCLLSSDCKPPLNAEERKNDPLSDVSLLDVQKYAKWLSERTGRTYRLPEQKEWEYAALSGGKQPVSDFNCRVSLGDKIIKGTGLISVKSGGSNAWGLKNYIGNVQEWVLGEERMFVVGGAYTDAHSKCKVGLTREQGDGADAVTGFRLLREEVQVDST